MPLSESRAEAALVRVSRPDGLTIGTGFAVSRDGDILTCHHVVAGLDRVRLETTAGQSCEVALDGAILLPELDLALISCPALQLDPLPVVLKAGNFPIPFWTKGYQYQSSQIRMAIPLSGTITGTTRRLGYEGAVRYELDAVLVLSEAGIDEGLSGAPVLHREWGVVVGVVNTAYSKGSISGFALPLSLAAARSAAVAALIEWNDRTVARYGPFLNGTGASELGARCLDRGVRYLERSALLVLDRYCARRQVSEAMESFLAGSARVLAVIGPSGVGKTTELARFAQSHREGRALVLLSTAALGGYAGQSLEAAVEAELRAVGPTELAGVSAVTTTVISALADNGQQLLVLLDALNEAPQALLAAFGPWLARTLDWVESSGVRLVVTCRPEYWENVRPYFPQQLMWSPLGDGRDCVLRIDEFTDEEASEALVTYGLGDSGLQVEDVQHPFLARVYWEIRQERKGEVGPLDRIDALDRFVRSRCGKIALSLGLPAASVEAVLVEAARGTLGRNDMALDGPAFQALSERHPLVTPRILSENLLVEIDGTYHFAFDEVAELLQARHIDLDDIGRPTFIDRLAEGEESVRLGVLVFALLELERARGTDALVKALEPFVEALERNANFWLTILLYRVFARAHDPAGLLCLMRRYAVASVEGDRGDSYLAGRFVRETRLPLDQKFELLRILVRHEHYYDWEWHHWASAGKPRRGVAAIAAAEIEAHPIECFRLLIPWLDDTSGLHEGNAAGVCDLAASLMWHFCELAFDDLYEILADSGKASRLMRELADRDPERVIALCERWSSGGMDARDVAAAACARHLLAHHAQTTGQRALAVLKTALSSKSEAARNEALSALLGNATTRDEVWKEVFARVVADDPAFSPSELSGALRTHFVPILEAFREYIKREGRRTSDILRVLSTYEGQSPSETMAIAEALDSAWHPGGVLDWDMAAAVEALLNRAPNDPECGPRLIRLAERLLREGSAEHVRTPLTYFVVAARVDEYRAGWARAILRMLIDTAKNDDDVLELLEKLGQNRQLIAAAADELLAHPPDDPETFERRLIGMATLNDQLAVVFAERIGPGRTYQPHGIARKFATLVASGTTPQSALSQIVDDELRGSKH